MRAGLVAVAVHFPRRWMPNAYWLLHHPDMVASAEESLLGKVWRPDPNGTLLFDEAMTPFVSDPFRGVKGRRWLAEGESALSLELAAARQALAAAGLGAEDVDLAIVGSFFPDELDTGNAAFLARDLGLVGAAWNLETACSSSVVGLQTAAALIAAEHHRHVLVVNSCSYSRYAPETESIAWANGDGASAFIMAPAAPRAGAATGFLGGHTQHTGATCGAMTLRFTDTETGPALRMRPDRSANKLLRETAEPLLKACVAKALDRAGVRQDDVDFFVFNTPTAWYADFCTRALGIDPARTTSTHDRYANLGPVLMPTNLHHALAHGLTGEGQTVLVYSVGSVSSASAAVMRLGPVALGPTPPEVPLGTPPGGLLPADSG